MCRRARILSKLLLSDLTVLCVRRYNISCECLQSVSFITNVNANVCPGRLFALLGSFRYTLNVVSGVGRRLHSLIYICWSLPRRPTLDAILLMTTMTVQENVLLAPFTTFRIGGAARFFTCVKTLVELEEAVAFAEEKKVDGKSLPIFILGGGSNVLVSDEGWNGLVIKVEPKGIIEEVEGQSIRFIVSAGENWDDFVKYTVEDRGLFGLENLSSIPGNVGASPVQNVGAYGAEAKDTIEWVEIYDPKTKKVEKLSNADCHFGYRDSIFKHERKGNVILRVAFLLKESGKLALEYKDLKRYFTGYVGTPSLRQTRNAIIQIRRNKFPDLTKIGTAGSFFRNVVISKVVYKELLKKYPFMPCFTVDDLNVKVPLAWILDKLCGFRGARRGEVGIYEKQALVLVNYGKGTAQDVKKLADEIIVSVKEKTGLVIFPEVEFV
jgi:UDP-N-acetylmuramate dehydrogenase